MVPGIEKSGLSEEVLQRMRRYRIYLGHDLVRLVGIQHGEARVVARNAGYLVLAFAGWGENPGSRYSGLHSYYPAETKVYRLIREVEVDYWEAEELIEWQTRPKKKRE